MAGVVSGQRAKKHAGSTLHSHTVGAIPLLSRIMQRMQLEPLLRQHVPDKDRRTRPGTARVDVVGEQPAGVAGTGLRRGGMGQPLRADLFGLAPDDLQRLNDDRLGRGLDRLFAALDTDLVLAVVRQVVEEFQVSLDELHNDSTTVSFYGSYPEAEQPHWILQRLAPAITWGHSKDHRPDLKQLLYTLTVTEDGGVPVYFQAHSGNMTDDQTHQATWLLLRQLVGRPDFVYVADCKLATTDNMNAIARQGGRFISILPAMRKENTRFRQRLRQQPDSVTWRELDQRRDEDDEVIDTLSVCTDELLSAEGYRLYWILSTRKQEQDAATRVSQTERAIRHLLELRERLSGPRTRFRQRDKVLQAVHEILQEYGVQDWLQVEIEEVQLESYRQAHRGRPGKDTQFKRTVRTQYTISWQIHAPALEEAGGMTASSR